MPTRRDDILLRFLLPEDRKAVTEILDAAFGTDDESRHVKRLRDAGDMAIELIAVNRAGPVGYIGFARHYAPKGWMSLSPLAVKPKYQGRGTGSELVRYGLDYARQAKAPAVTVLGNRRFYQRFGFTRKAAENLETDYPPEHTLLYPIAPRTAGTSARLVYPDAFTQF
ncbi:MAG: GNAT family N-acetyltransferase [Pseudooceanicola atlanticus]